LDPLWKSDMLGIDDNEEANIEDYWMEDNVDNQNGSVQNIATKAHPININWVQGVSIWSWKWQDYLLCGRRLVGDNLGASILRHT